MWQDLMTTAQQKLNDFKASLRNSLQQLQREGDVLERDLEIFEGRLESDAWNDSFVTLPTAPPVSAPSCSATTKVSTPTA